MKPDVIAMTETRLSVRGGGTAPFLLENMTSIEKSPPKYWPLWVLKMEHPFSWITGYKSDNSVYCTPPYAWVHPTSTGIFLHWFTEYLELVATCPYSGPHSLNNYGCTFWECTTYLPATTLQRSWPRVLLESYGWRFKSSRRSSEIFSQCFPFGLAIHYIQRLLLTNL